MTRDQKNQFAALVDQDAQGTSTSAKRDRERSPWKPASAVGKGGAAAPPAPSSEIVLSSGCLKQIGDVFDERFNANIKPITDHL